MTTITLPLTEAQAVAIVVAADAFGVKPWEMAVHVLDFKRQCTRIDGQDAPVSDAGTMGP